jgi:predicted Zn-dependent protease
LAAEWYEIGNAWYDQGKWDRAGTAYSRALALDSKLSAASYNLARALAESGDFVGALIAINGVIAGDPENVRALSTKAYILYKSGDARAALDVYARVLALEPFAPDALYNAALLREAAGEWTAALSGLEDYMKAKPDDEKFLLLYARALAEAKKGDEAIDAYGRLSKGGKLKAEDWIRLGKLHEAGRDYAKAIEDLAQAVALDPKLSGAWFDLARLRLAEAEDGKGGMEALTKALEAGFADKERAAALLAEPVLAEREAAAGALRAKGLVP